MQWPLAVVVVADDEGDRVAGLSGFAVGQFEDLQSTRFVFFRFGADHFGRSEFHFDLAGRFDLCGHDRVLVAGPQQSRVDSVGQAGFVRLFQFALRPVAQVLAKVEQFQMSDKARGVEDASFPFAGFDAAGSRSSLDATEFVISRVVVGADSRADSGIDNAVLHTGHAGDLDVAAGRGHRADRAESWSVNRDSICWLSSRLAVGIAELGDGVFRVEAQAMVGVVMDRVVAVAAVENELVGVTIVVAAGHPAGTRIVDRRAVILNGHPRFGLRERHWPGIVDDGRNVRSPGGACRRGSVRCQSWRQ